MSDNKSSEEKEKAEREKFAAHNREEVCLCESCRVARFPFGRGV